MRHEQEMVRQFHEQSKSTIANRPDGLSDRDAFLRANLISEEFDELLEAMGVETIEGSIVDWTRKPYDIVRTADALADLLYVVLGTAVSCGIDIEPVFHEVHRSNMTKFVDGTFREDGKYVKGPNYSPANIKRIVHSQIAG